MDCFLDGVKYADKVEMAAFGLNRLLFGSNKNENEKQEAEEIEHEDPRITLKKFYDALSKPFLSKDGTVQYRYQLNMGKLGDATISNIVDGISQFENRPRKTNILTETSISITRDPAPYAIITSGDEVNQFVSILSELKQFLIANTENNVFNKNARLADLLPALPSRAPVTPRGRGGRRTKRAKHTRHTKRSKRTKQTRRRKH